MRELDLRFIHVLDFNFRNFDSLQSPYGTTAKEDSVYNPCVVCFGSSGMCLSPLALSFTILENSSRFILEQILILPCQKKKPFLKNTS